MSRSSRSAVVLALAAAALLALAAVAAAAPTQRTLVVERPDSGERLLATPVENGTTVALEYTHSVEKTPITETYVVRGDRLVLARMTFESYGWGLPAGAEVTRENGTFVTHPGRETEALGVAPGRIAGHELVVGGRTYDLTARADAEAVRITVEHRRDLSIGFDSWRHS